MRTIDTAILHEIYKKDGGGMVIPCLLEIETGNYPTVYLVNNNEEIVYGGHTYLPYIFSFDFPEETGSTASLAVDNTSLELMEIVRNAEPPMTLRVRAMYYNDVSGIVVEELANWEMTVSGFSYDKRTIRIDLRYKLDLDKQMPLDTFSPTATPCIY